MNQGGSQSCQSHGSKLGRLGDSLICLFVCFIRVSRLQLGRFLGGIFNFPAAADVGGSAHLAQCFALSLPPAKMGVLFCPASERENFSGGNKAIFLLIKEELLVPSLCF